MKRFFSLLLSMSLLLPVSNFCYAEGEKPQLSASTSGLDISLSWSEVGGALGYTMYYAPYPAGSPVLSTDLGNLTDLSAKLWKGASLYVAVKSRDAQGSSDYSNVETVATESDTTGFAPTDLAMSHVGFLARGLGIRTAGSERETATRNYIVGQFEALGYTATVQPFEFEQDGATLNSANVVVVKPGASEKQIIVGAHYDSVGVGEGVSDNATGVAVMLTAASELAEKELPHTIRFIAFGAEEVGLQGSNDYAGRMSAEEIANTACMLNLDTLAGGDKIYVYGDADAGGWVREQLLSIATEMEISLSTNPGLNEAYPAGTTGDWSDHAPFKALGIPHAYLESTNWEIGELDGYTQTDNHGEIWHTEKDTLAFFNTEYPGRIEEQLTSFIKVLDAFLAVAEPPASEQSPEARLKSAPIVNYTKRNGEAF